MVSGLLRQKSVEHLIGKASQLGRGRTRDFPLEEVLESDTLVSKCCHVRARALLWTAIVCSPGDNYPIMGHPSEKDNDSQTGPLLIV